MPFRRHHKQKTPWSAPSRKRAFGRAPVVAALAAVIALPFAAPAPALASSDVVAGVRDALYLPKGMELNAIAPAGSRGGLGALYSSPAAHPSMQASDSLPSTFDLRDVDGTSYVTRVKNQNPWGSCWAFGALSALESNLIMQGAASANPQASNYVDLSEYFVAGFGRMEVPSEFLARIGASSQEGEGVTAAAGMAYLETGGYILDAATWIMSMGGLPAESTVPYKSDDGTILEWEDTYGKATCFSPYEPWTLDEALRADTTNRVAGVESAVMMPGPYNSYYDANEEMVLGEYDPSSTEAVKRAIMETGAVAAYYYADVALPDDETNETQYFSMKNWCQYACDPLQPSHYVTVVGWDDDFSRENFPTAPAGDGAWIVKNSWGSTDGGPGEYSEWGIDGSGYFYLSYYDKTIYSFESLKAEADIDPNRIIQQYDLLGVSEAFIGALLTDQEASVANVFTAEEDMLVESVTAYTGTADTEMDVAIYLLDDEASEPDSGALVATCAKDTPYVGYYTIDLAKPVPVQAGQRYSVVQTVHGTVGDGEGGEVSVWGIPVERGISREFVDENGISVYYDAVSNRGESYVGFDGEWEDAVELNEDPVLTSNGDFTYGNACIKVYGSPADLPDAGEFTVLHTNDTHGRYSVKGSGNDAVNAFSAVAALAEDEGADLILDAGDTFHGTAFATSSKGDAIAQLMDAAGYDAATPGNHDWSYGSDRLAEIDADADFSVLAANVVDGDTGEPLFENPYLLREVALADQEGNLTGRSVTVGVFGVIDEDFYGSTAPSSVAGVEFADSVQAANKIASQLRAAGADVVVALAHNEDPQAFAASTKGVDAVIAGHEHIEIDKTVEGADGRSVAVVEVASSPTSEYFGSIGVLTLELKEAARGASGVTFAVSGHQSNPVRTVGAARPNKDIDTLTAALEEENKAALAQVIGQSSRAYLYEESSATAPGGWELVRTEDTPIGHVVTTSYLAQTGADLAFENAGGIRGGIPAGNVTAGDILGVSPYGNTLATYKMTGAQVLDAIERSLSISAECREVLAKQKAAVQAGEDPTRYAWPKDSGSVLAVGGATMTVDWAKPDGHRVVKISVGEKPLDSQREYTVALNSYLPGAADTYPSFARAELVHEYGTCEEALCALIARADWEQVMDRVSGSVTYVPEDDAGNTGGGSTGGSSTGGSTSGTGGGGTRPGGLPSTGDPALAYASLAAAGAIISLVLAYLTANRPRGRAADGDK